MALFRHGFRPSRLPNRPYRYSYCRCTRSRRTMPNGRKAVFCVQSACRGDAAPDARLQHGLSRPQARRPGFQPCCAAAGCRSECSAGCTAGCRADCADRCRNGCRRTCRSTERFDVAARSGPLGPVTACLSRQMHGTVASRTRIGALGVTQSDHGSRGPNRISGSSTDRRSGDGAGVGGRRADETMTDHRAARSLIDTPGRAVGA